MTNFVMYYSADEYAQMGEQGLIDDVFKHIEIYETCYDVKFKDLNKTNVGENTIKIELIME